jgi:hypothetical protein
MQLPVIAYTLRRNLLRSIRGRLYTPKEWSKPAMLKETRLQPARDRPHAAASVDSLPGLYYGEYIEKFKDEYKPFEANLTYLDGMTPRKFLLEKGGRLR